LVLCEVNGRETEPQLIFSTPKLHYPFSKDQGARKYRFPKGIRRVEVYEKLDGTSVCAYGYRDADGNRFLTYKLRLNPIIGNGKFGPFLTMWQELLAERPDLPAQLESARLGDLSVSFEMYGHRNIILVRYPVALDTRMLFATPQDGSGTIPPSDPRLAGLAPWALQAETVLECPADLTDFYNHKRAEADSKNTVFKVGDKVQIDGTEGYVFYIEDGNGQWHLYKAKPPSVETEHWQEGEPSAHAIDESRIYPTVMNAFESCEDTPTVEDIRTLLAEEFTAEEIGLSMERIEKTLQQVVFDLRMNDKVSAVYKHLDLNWARDGKTMVMRAMTQGFQGQERAAVYNTLVRLGIVSD